MKSKILISAFVLAALQLVHAQNKSLTQLTLMTSKGHPMQYYVSLPEGWNATKKWPVVVILEAAEKEYKTNIERFIAARGTMPFILIAPIHTNNGNQGRRDPAIFPYSKETWDYIEQTGDCKFNDDGIHQIMSDVQDLYHAEEKYFITGFEAGTHTLWSVVLNHPEYLRAAAPVSGNFRNRCVDDSTISKDPSKITLPIKGFAGELDAVWGPKGGNFNQWNDAKALAIKNGFKGISETIVAGKEHVPLPKEVLEYFYSLL
jgi:poly(3-hydroxybutyrate) depolymerase